MKITNVEALKKIAKEIRKGIIEEVYNAKSGHPGGSLSCSDILTVLYFNQMNIDEKKPDDPNRDRLVLSKGHASPALYSVLAQKGYFDKQLLQTFRKIGSNLQGHPDMNKVPGVDMTTGSLGQGISTAVGMAIAAIGIIIANNSVENFKSLVAENFAREDLSVYGFQMGAPVVNGELKVAAFIIFCIGAALLMVVVAMIFRNLHLIFKKSENSTPFQKDNVRMMREIGIFAIAIPVIGFIMSVITRLVCGVDFAEISIDMGGISMGIIVLCFSQFFAHGVELENDVDGLL